MRRTAPQLGHAVLAVGIIVATAPFACGQVATLGKGHQLLVNSGLQIWGLNTDKTYAFNYNNLANLNMNAVVWSHGQSNPGVLSAGQKWGKWVDYTGSPATALDGTEMAHYSDLVAIQVGDEQQSDLENPNGFTKAWFDAAHAGNYFTDKLLYVNSTFVNDVGAYLNFIASANPDAISWDAYPFGTTGVYPYNWLGKSQIFRRSGLGSYIGASGAAPRPYGLYLQTYHAGDGARDPGDLEMRWQQFTAWTLGYTFVDAFTAGGGNTSLFQSGNMNLPAEPQYSQFRESARQSMNLSPALVKLISYGYGPNIVLGKDAAGSTNPVPIDWPVFNQANAPPNQQYLTGVSAQNLGTKNGGQPGDVYVGFFNPLHTSYGDPAGTAYFMVTNALGAYLQDPTLLVGDCMQRITLDFDFGATTINSLQRLSRDTGLVEVVPLTYISDNKYRLVFDLEGGTGDLFKYNDGTPFVGLELPEPSVYWDSDGNAGNNNLTTGDGLGGSGNWDGPPPNKWFNGASNGAWVEGSGAVLTGAAGTVTLADPHSVSSLTFKSDGYAITGSTLTMTAPFISVDAGVSASIDSTIAGSAGLVKNGPGTLNLTHANSYSGGTTINEGVLGIISNAVGQNPASPAVNITINTGATLRFNQNNLTLTAQRMIALGAGGAVVDTSFNNGIAGAISGGTLIKSGAGTLTLSAANSHAGTTINGGAVVVTSDANLGAAPASFTAGNITLDGGTLRFGASFDLSNNRGIALGAGGGTIDTQGFSNPSGYTQPNGISGSGNLTKVGGGTFFMNTPAGQLNNSWSGNLILQEGTWKISERGGLPFNPPTSAGSPVYPGQITFDGGTLQIAAAIPNVTNGRRGITVESGGGTFDTQGFTFNWAGPLAGSDPAAVLTKIGSGTLQFNTNTVPAPSTYTGILHVVEGVLVVNGSGAMGPLASIQLSNAAGVSLTISGSGTTIGSLTGGGAAGGNVALNTSLTVGGNNNSTTFNGRLSGAGGLAKTGAGVLTLAPLSGGNTYNGVTTVSGGTLMVMNATGSGTGNGPVVVNAGGTLGGTGTISGIVTSSGTVAPGNSPGTLHLGGSYTQQAAGMLEIEIASTASFDVLEISGAASLAGTLAVSLSGGFMPAAGDEFEIITAAGFGGSSFTDSDLPALPGLVWNVNYSANAVTLEVASAGLPGDFNGDGSVDTADYVVWRRGLGTIYTEEDYDTWQNNFGAQAGNGASDAGHSAVPEPATWISLSLACAALLTRLGFFSRVPTLEPRRCR